MPTPKEDALTAEHERHAQVLLRLLAEIEDELAKQNAFFESSDQQASRSSGTPQNRDSR